MRNSGHSIIKGKKITFSFNGERMRGFQGDTLASALIANNVKVVGRSFKYHRPRGIFSAGSEEPNALMEIGRGSYQEPNTKATTVELFDGFISEYLAYKIIFVFSNSAGDVAAQLGSGSSAYITTGYYSQSNYAKQGGGPTVGEWQNGTRVPFHDNNKKGAGELHIFDPTSTEVGKIIHFQGLSMRNTTSFGSNLQVGFRSGVLDNATAMTKAQMISEGNFTSLRWVVYGIK